MIEPTREQLAKIDHLGGIYDSVECRPRVLQLPMTSSLRAAPGGMGVIETISAEVVIDVVCWHYRPSGAKIVAHALTIHPDGTESDRR